MFTRKLIVILLPLGMLILIGLLLPLLSTLGVFFGSLLLGAVLGVALGLLLPLAGATRLREPFAHLLWIPAAVTLLVLIYQYLASLGVSWPLLRLLATLDSRLITVESAFAAYMITFSVRTGRGI
ncbi:MAG: hypothetical protein IKE08_07635 [Clostridia bacterium]|nr:hypothetical protein [Clostridia bacterium]MBR2602545.1 hypothetical protein [Clostridia bacterium]MBR2664535.1 hypothetical protein [Clostridia bacterium]